MRHWISFAVAIVALTACKAKDSPSTATTSGPASPTTAALPVADPIADDVNNYTLDMDKMNKWMKAVKGFAVEARTDSAAADAASLDAGVPIREKIAKLEANPTARKILGAAGISARDYAMTTTTYIQAGMIASLMKTQPGFKVPFGQNMANIAFINVHGAEIKASMKRIEAEMQ